MKTDYTQTERLWIYLSLVNGLGPKSFYKIISEAVDICSFYDNAEEILKKVKLNEAVEAGILACVKKSRIDDFFEVLIKLKIEAICSFNSNYPLYLNDIASPPPVLYKKGNIEHLNDRTFAIVGTRKCLPSGFEEVKEISHELAKSGVYIISGMASGIDRAAHIGAIEANGTTAAVLAGGVENPFPKSNEKLYYKILEAGCVFSENPPNVPTLAGSFPARNRIIAGMSRGVYFGEAPKKSGASITAKYATDFDRTIFAKRGDNFRYELANSLIDSGAVEVTSISDILDEMNWSEGIGENILFKQNAALLEPEKEIKKIKPKVLLDFYEQEIYNLLLSGYSDIEIMLNVLDIPASKFNTAVTMMEINGIILRLPGKQLKIK